MSLPQPDQAHLSAPAEQQVENEQPAPQVPMTMAPQPEEEREKLQLRGGRDGLCPGRFCFCIPCPLPCDFCII